MFIFTGLFLIYMSDMDLCYWLCSFILPAGCLSCVATTSKRWTLHSKFGAKVFIPAMVVGTIDFYYFIRLSVTLTEVTSSAERKTSWAHFRAHS